MGPTDTTDLLQMSASGLDLGLYGINGIDQHNVLRTLLLRLTRICARVTILGYSSAITTFINENVISNIRLLWIIMSS